MDANFEKPIDDFGCIELLLFYYNISSVFWTNVFLMASSLINEIFGQLCFAVCEKVLMAVRQICEPDDQKKPLDMKHFPSDTMLMRQQRQREKNDFEKFAWLKRKMVEKEMHNERFTIYDWLFGGIDVVLGTKPRIPQRYCGDFNEMDSMPRFTKPTTKDRTSLRKLNTSTAVVYALDPSTEQLICAYLGVSSSSVFQKLC